MERATCRDLPQGRVVCINLGRVASSVFVKLELSTNPAGRHRKGYRRCGYGGNAQGSCISPGVHECTDALTATLSS